MNIVVYKTHEIDDKTWKAITQGFNESFDRSKTAEEFKAYYCNTILGYSYHALAFNELDEILAGSTTIFPFIYLVNGKHELFGTSGGTFVKKEYRSDIFIYKDLVEALRVYCQQDKMRVIYGVSNKNSFRYAIKILEVNHLMDLDYYALPIRLGCILKTHWQPLVNFASILFCFSLAFLNRIISYLINHKASQSKVSIDFNDALIKTRFKSGYIVINDEKYFITYKVVIEDGIRTIYLMEYRENGIRSYRALSKAIIKILKHEKADIILFIGTIHHKQLGLFKIPVSRQPKRLPLTYEIVGPSSDSFKTIIADHKNWDFSLVNFDVR